MSAHPSSSSKDSQKQPTTDSTRVSISDLNYQTGTPSSAPSSGSVHHPYVYAQDDRASTEVIGNGAPPLPLSPPLWSHRISSSFSVLAEQLLSTSRAIAQLQIPSATTSERDRHEDDDDSYGLASLSERLDAVESMQERLYHEFQDLRDLVTSRKENSRRDDIEIVETSTRAHGDITEIQTEASQVEAVVKELKELQDRVKLSEQQLYARLHNAAAVVKKTPIKALMTSTGKPPANFPATRGEFEHLTKERYEAIMKAYGLPISGDTATKRENLRVFLGLPPA